MNEQWEDGIIKIAYLPIDERPCNVQMILVLTKLVRPYYLGCSGVEKINNRGVVEC